MQLFYKFNPSRLLTASICFGHGAAIGALIFVPIPKTALFLLLAVLVCSALYYVLRDARLVLACAWTSMHLEEDRVILFNRGGDKLIGKLLRSSLVTPYLVLLNVANPDHFRMQNVVLMPDSMDTESFRQLRVALKWGVKLAA